MSDTNSFRDRIEIFVHEINATGNINTDYLSTAELDNVIEEMAVLRFSRDCPLKKIHNQAGDGSAFKFSLPSDWIDGFSTYTHEIEYPVTADTQEPTFLDDEDWSIYFDGSTEAEMILFKTFTPGSNSSFNFRFTTTHTVSSTESTIPAGKEDAFIYIATAYACEALSGRFSHNEDSTFGADSVDHRTVATMFRDQAKRFKTLYQDVMFSQDKHHGITIFKDFDTAFQSERDHIIHLSSKR